jgi:predicted RNA-binding protein with TRAM domain
VNYGENNGFSKPVEIDNEYVVDITDTGRDGDGVTRIGGLIVFVKNGKAGYKNVKIRINSVKDNFAIAEIVAGSTDTASNP